MASCEWIETGSDLISGLPVDLKERILECLPTREVARTALLSTHWKDVCLRHGRLAFDWDFIKWVQECKLDSTTVITIIDNSLLLRVGLVKKFTLHISCFGVQLQQSDINRWCFLLSTNGVGELNLSSLCGLHRKYKLPFCIVSCHTIKHLNLQGFLIDLPVDGGCIFPGITSLVLEDVSFKHNNVKGNVVYSIPKLEKLAYQICDGIEKIDISAPNLRSFSQLYSNCFPYVSIPRWLIAIKYLCLSADLSETAKLAEEAPTLRNLQVMKLNRFRFGCERHLKRAIQLLEKSPNLCTLEIAAEKHEEWIDDKEDPSRIFEGPDIINKNLEMLNTVKIEWFKGSRHEILFLKALLSKSVALDKVVVKELHNRHNATALINSRKLLDFPRASPKAKIVFVEYNNFNYRLIDPPEF